MLLLGSAADMAARGKRKEERGKRKEERGKRNPESDKDVPWYLYALAFDAET